MQSDATRLDVIYVEMRRVLVQRLMRIVKDASVAEEIAQEAYIRSRRAIERTDAQSVEAFLWTAARNLAIDFVRREKVRSARHDGDIASNRMEAVADERVSVEEQLIHRDQIRIFSEALAKLPKRVQRAWYLSRMEGKSYPEIATELGVSPNTVFNDIKMAMATLYDLRKKLD